MLSMLLELENLVEELDHHHTVMQMVQIVWQHLEEEVENHFGQQRVEVIWKQLIFNQLLLQLSRM